jgi:uncharacterized protein (TIGR02996 family)
MAKRAGTPSADLSGPDGERAAFVAAIRDAPEDDAPRLVFADWLGEHGEPDRGEFIRLQCRSPGSPRALELLQAHESEWLAPLKRPEAYQLPPEAFAGGFLTYARLTPARFRRAGAELFARHPIRRVTFPLRDEKELADLANCPELAHLTGVSLAGRLLGGGLWAFLESPHLTRLRDLALLGGREPALALALHPRLAQISSLRISGQVHYAAYSCVGGDGLTALLRSPHFALTELDVSGTQCWADAGHEDTVQGGCILANVGHEGLVALAGEPAAARLKALDVSYNNLTHFGVQALLESPYLGGLEALFIDEICDGPLGGGQTGIDLLNPPANVGALRAKSGARLRRAPWSWWKW